MDNQQAKALLEKYHQGLCTDEEKAGVESWYLSIEHQEAHVSHIEIEAAMNEVRQNLPAQDLHQRKLWPRIAVAASILFCLGIAFYFYRAGHQPQSVAQFADHDFKPGGNKAILTLAGGKQILLAGAKNGQLAIQGHTVINKKAEGEIIYNNGQSSNTEATVYNTMSTPLGGQYQLTLADGTRVWLNAASSIKYPTAFNGEDRQVEITGEAYFEVAHNAAKPFKVTSNGQTVEVLGTHFNINAYHDEPGIKTTLLEGIVRINSNFERTIIKPGQQVTLIADKFSINEVDTEEVTAWKNGLFQFSDESLESIMRKISRWYDVDVVYVNKDIKSLPLTGIISHFTKASKVLRMLELTKQVHFKIEGRKIFVMSVNDSSSAVK